jgi:hypothetical protein
VQTLANHSPFLVLPSIGQQSRIPINLHPGFCIIISQPNIGRATLGNPKVIILFGNNTSSRGHKGKMLEIFTAQKLVGD